MHSILRRQSLVMCSRQALPVEDFLSALELYLQLSVVIAIVFVLMPILGIVLAESALRAPRLLLYSIMRLISRHSEHMTDYVSDYAPAANVTSQCPAGWASPAGQETSMR